MSRAASRDCHSMIWPNRANWCRSAPYARDSLANTMAALEAAQQQWQQIQKRESPAAINCISHVNSHPELSTTVSNRQKLESQLQENIAVQNVVPPRFGCWIQEFSTLSDDAKIYKAHGPLILPQTLAEASDLVAKRLEFIRAEIDRTEQKLKELEGKGQNIRSEILTLSNEPVKQAWRRSRNRVSLQCKNLGRSAVAFRRLVF